MVLTNAIFYNVNNNYFHHEVNSIEYGKNAFFLGIYSLQTIEMLKKLFKKIIAWNYVVNCLFFEVTSVWECCYLLKRTFISFSLTLLV